MEDMTIYQYETFDQFLRDRVLTGRGGRPLSTRKLAQSLGYRSPRTVGMVLSGERPPSRELTTRICDKIGLGPRERAYVQELARLEGRGNVGDEGALGKIKPRNLYERTLTGDEFRLISEWFYIPIIVLAQNRVIPDDPEWLSRTFARRLTTAQARHALRRLEENGFLVRTPDGRFAAKPEAFATRQDVSDERVRAYHHQMLARAAEALREKTPEERCFQALTLNVSTADLPRVKQAVLHFLGELTRDFERESGDSLMQTNIQIFSIAKV